MFGTTVITSITFQDCIAVNFLRVFSIFMRVLPRSVALSIASFLGACFSLIAKRRFTAERNIRYALGISLNDHQIQSVARGAYQSLFITLCELLLMRRWSNQSIHNMISYNDEQMIREYLNDKRGVIFVTGHY